MSIYPKYRAKNVKLKMINRLGKVTNWLPGNKMADRVEDSNTILIESLKENAKNKLNKAKTG